MSATDPIDAARLGLLLGDLRLPAIKHIGLASRKWRAPSVKDEALNVRTEEAVYA